MSIPLVFVKQKPDHSVSNPMSRAKTNVLKFIKLILFLSANNPQTVQPVNTAETWTITITVSSRRMQHFHKYPKLNISEHEIIACIMPQTPLITEKQAVNIKLTCSKYGFVNCKT
jgi:hypothetical protein